MHSKNLKETLMVGLVYCSSSDSYDITLDNPPHFIVYYVHNGEINYEDNQRTWTTRQRLSTGDDTVHTPYTT